MTRQAVWQVLLSPHDAFGYVQHDDDYSFLLTTRHDRAWTIQPRWAEHPVRDVSPRHDLLREQAAFRIDEPRSEIQGSHWRHDGALRDYRGVSRTLKRGDTYPHRSRLVSDTRRLLPQEGRGSSWHNHLDDHQEARRPLAA